MGTRQERNIYQGCYGASAKSSEVKKWIKQSILSNIGRQSKGMPRCTISIWGAPGTSKTSIVKSLQNEEVEFDGVLQKIRVIDIPLAQIEEMGDVTGFPRIFAMNGKLMGRYTTRLYGVSEEEMPEICQKLKKFNLFPANR